MSTLLSICWPAIGTLVALFGGVALLFLLLDWSIQDECRWKKIVACVVLGCLILLGIYATYVGLSNAMCK